MSMVAVPIRDGMSLVLAAAKLRAFELHDLHITEGSTSAMQTEVDRMSMLDAEDAELDYVFGSYVLLGDGDDHMLAGVSVLTPSDVVNAKCSVGEFAKEVCIAPHTFDILVEIDAVDQTSIAELADQLDYVMPPEWVARLDALVSKHRPVPVARSSKHSRYASTVMARAALMTETAGALHLCVCGNHAGSDELCNACRERACSKRPREVTAL